MLIFGVPAALQQQGYSPITNDAAAGVRVDWPRVAIVASILLAAIIVNVIVNVKFSAYSDRFPFVGAGCGPQSSSRAVAQAGVVAATGRVQRQRVPSFAHRVRFADAGGETAAASWQTALGLGFVSRCSTTSR